MGRRRTLARRTAVAVLLNACLVLVGFPATANGAFPGADGKIAFAKDLFLDPNSGTHQLDIFSVEPNGTGLANITNTPTASSYDQESDPAWSPDGSRLAFEAGPSPRHLWVMNADGTDRRRVTTDPYPFGEGDRNPSWSPDGERIIFSRDLQPGPCSRFECDEIFTVRPDGTGLTRLTNNSLSDGHPVFSPDGQRIAFSRRLCSGFPDTTCITDIYTMNADGTGETLLTPGGTSSDVDPSWSPDGSAIAFDSNRHGCCSGFEIYTMNADGTDPARLTFNDGSGSRFLDAMQPAWSPSGASIAFRSLQRSTTGLTDHEILTVRLDGSAPTVVTDDDIDDASPDWQPIPNRPPDCSGARSDPSILLPANRKLTLVFVSGVTDPDGDLLSITIDGVSQDEPVRSSGDPTAPDARAASAPDMVQLRAERSPKGDGRVYRVGFTATDGRGGSCTGSTVVSVPRHTQEPAVDSAPPSFDSFGG